MKILLFISALFLTSCAFGPFANHETARTVGESKFETALGYGQVGYVLKANFGITDNLDVGLQVESLSIGAKVKYGFLINNESGWSFSSALGAGTSIGGDHYYGDLMASYIIGSWEPYMQLRLVQVNVDPTEFKSESGLFDITTPATSYKYGQVFIGTRYWFNSNWLFSMEASTFFNEAAGIDFKSPVLYSIAFGYRL